MLFDAKIGFVQMNIGARFAVSQKLKDQKLFFQKEASYYKNTVPLRTLGWTSSVQKS